MVIIVFGLPGTGKSYFATRLAKMLNADYVNTDMVRKQLFAHPEYSEEEKIMIYKELLDEMYHHAHSKKSLVLDGTFYQKDIREEFIQLAYDLNIDLRWIEIMASESVIRERVVKKREDSDADYSIYRLIKEQYTPFGNGHLLRLTSTNQNIGHMLQQAKTYLENKIHG